MEGGITEILLEYGSLGLFAAFLVWQHLSMQKRFDQMVEKFQGQLEKIRGDQKEDIQGLRDRYDSVIKTYNDERTEIRLNLAEKVTKLSDKVNEVAQEMQTLPFDGLQIQIEAISLNQRNSHLLLEKGMDVMKELQEDAKLKAMARKLSDAKE
jgi:chitinase